MIVGGPRMKTIWITALILLLMVVGCARKENDPADVRAIKRSSADWDDAWNEGDIDALLALYTNDAVVMGPNEPAVTGREAMRARFRSSLEPTMRQEMARFVRTSRSARRSATRWSTSS